MLSRKKFPGKEEKEKIIYILRRHWLIEFWIFIRYLFLAAIPVAIYFYAQHFFPEWQNYNQIYALVVLAVSIYYLNILLFFFQSWIDYYLDVWIITNLKIVSIDQRRLFSRHISRMSFNRLQDATSETKGFLATIFKFGNVHIQSAGAKERFVLKQIPNPDEVTKDLISFSHQLKTVDHLHENKTLWLLSAKKADRSETD